MSESDSDLTMFEGDAAASVEPAAPEPQPGLDETVVPQQRQQHRVPPEALAAEREQRRRAEERAKSLEAMVDQGNQRLQQMLEAISASQKAAPAQPAPDKTQDPIGYFEARTSEQQRKMDELAAWKAETEKAAQAARVGQGFVQRYQSDAAAFSQSQPDFPAAYNFVAQQLTADLVATGFTPQQAMQQLHVFEREAATNAWQNGANPAERMYQLAVKRGFKSQVRDQAQEGQAMANGEDDLDVIERGQKRAGQPLSRGSTRGSPYAGMKFEQMANMTDAEWAKVPDAIRNKALRGPGG